MHWIIGDIHGMFGPLDALLNAIRRIDSHAILYFVGDYVNRGPESKRVIDLLLTLPNGHFLRGNHDDILDQVLCGASYAENATAGNRLAAFQWFMQYGLDNTLCSYGADLAQLQFIAKNPSDSNLDAALQCVPSVHREFISNLKPMAFGPGFFVAHGKWDPADDVDAELTLSRLNIDSALRHRLLWNRFTVSEIIGKKSWPVVGYFGHTTVDNYPDLLWGSELAPICGEKMMLLDTAAALLAHGRLSAVCHEDGRIVQVDRAGKLIAE